MALTGFCPGNNTQILRKSLRARITSLTALHSSFSKCALHPQCYIENHHLKIGSAQINIYVDMAKK